MSESFHKTNQQGLNQRRDALEKMVLRHLHAYPYPVRQLRDAAAYSIRSGGHRWRPLIFLEIHRLLSSRTPPAAVMSAASSVEFIHTASIILDDLPSMDDAKLRRGRETCHLRFGQSVALLAALWLSDVAQHYITKLDAKNNPHSGVRLEEKFRQVRGQMMLGQYVDLQQRNFTKKQIIETYRLKSGALYGFTAAAPAWILGLSDDAAILERFGNMLGIAYQISDDIADVTSSTKRIGKDIGKDSGKNTIPRVCNLSEARHLRDAYTQKAIAELRKLRWSTDHLIQLAREIVHFDE